MFAGRAVVAKQRSPGSGAVRRVVAPARALDAPGARHPPQVRRRLAHLGASDEIAERVLGHKVAWAVVLAGVVEAGADSGGGDEDLRLWFFNAGYAAGVQVSDVRLRVPAR